MKSGQGCRRGLKEWLDGGKESHGQVWCALVNQNRFHRFFVWISLIGEGGTRWLRSVKQKRGIVGVGHT